MGTTERLFDSLPTLQWKTQKSVGEDGQHYQWRMGVRLLFEPTKERRFWGYQNDWLDGPVRRFGLGPLYFVARESWEKLPNTDTQ